MKPIFHRLRKRLGSDKGLALGLLILTVFLIVSVVFLFVVPASSNRSSLSEAFQPPSAKHWLGTDQLGRDILARLLAGAPLEARVVTEVLLIAGLLGGTLGVLSGFLGGAVDALVMRLADIFLSFPNFLLAMAIAAAIGPSLENAMLAVAISLWPRYARLLRGQFLALRTVSFVEAAVAIGASRLRVAVVHMLRNCVGPLVVQLSLDAGLAILTTSALSFVGLGAKPPTPEWGVMISDTRLYISFYWWMPLFPGLCITLVACGFMFTGDGLQDLLNPRMRIRRSRLWRRRDGPRGASRPSEREVPHE